MADDSGSKAVLPEEKVEPTSEKSKTSPEVKATTSNDPEASSTSTAGAAKDDGAVTMMDVLQEEAELEEDAAAVLGSADDKHCTYLSGGYMTRQALYSCVTCTQPKSDDYQPAGVCLACSYHCHEGHELVELYTKRLFRCDCGNKKFPAEAKCKLDPHKNPENADNKYNQNFKGLYCTCHRPYPDPEDPVEDEMIQCLLCEDWLHGRHLERDNVPKDQAYSEMICVSCVRTHPFLMAYKDKTVKVKDGKTSEAENVDVESNCDEEPKAKKAKVECLVKAAGEQKPQTLFFIGNWRDGLCKCEDCATIYRNGSLEFLSNPEDTVHHYESESKKAGSSYDDGMKALSEMDRVKQMQAMDQYASMKANLFGYLEKFRESGKVVSKEDIDAFFGQMKSAGKKPNVEVIPDNCR